MIRKVFIYALVLICLAGCRSESDHSGEKRIFKYNQADNINSLDPAFAKSQNNMWAVNQIFDGLVTLDDSMRVVPRIAKSWEVDESGTKFTFHLDQRYSFHPDASVDERSSLNVNARDVVYSFERILSDEVNSPGSWIFADIVSKQEPFIAINDSTFVLRLKSAFQPIMGILTMQYCSILPQEAVEYYGKIFRNHPIGTGPFKLKRWQEHHALYLEKNEAYPEINHNLDGIKVSFIPDKKIAFFEFLNGTLDFFSGVESSFGSEILNKNGELRDDRRSSIQMFSNPYLNLEYVGINMELAKGSAFEDPNFRKALSYSIDKDELLSVLKNNIGKPAHQGVIPRGLVGFNENMKGFRFDREKAKQLLSLVDDNLLKEPIKVSTNADYIDVITYVAKSWENIGLEVEIDLMESAILRQQMRNGEIQLFRASWIADYPDEESYLCLFYGENPAPPNYTRFRNRDFDLLYKEAILSSNPQRRSNLYAKMDSLVIANAPLIPLYYDETALFVSKEITAGIKANSLNLLDTRFIRKN